MELIYCNFLMHYAGGKTQAVQSSWDDKIFASFTAAKKWHIWNKEKVWSVTLPKVSLL